MSRERRQTLAPTQRAAFSHGADGTVAKAQEDFPLPRVPNGTADGAPHKQFVQGLDLKVHGVDH